MQNRIFSTDSPKAIKANKFGWLNAIQYLAPSDLGGVGNLCGNASPACIALCLGWFSGNAELYNSVRESRIVKTRRFMHDRKAYLRDVARSIDLLQIRALKMKMALCIRLNGSSDVPWEHIKLDDGRSLLQRFAHIQFVDYTKSVKRMLRFCAGLMPRNYNLTFSRSEINEAECYQVLKAGGNVAVVFGGKKPATFMGVPVIDGDESDLRNLDPKGVVVGLSPKGRKAKADQLNFVVRI
jgi:hypothetical protein